MMTDKPGLFLTADPCPSGTGGVPHARAPRLARLEAAAPRETV
ncbi:hypothetical protein [Streptomyces phaeofaciens]|nr:hypothetical protein [Streptomyces phaeofaciens]